LFNYKYRTIFETIEAILLELERPQVFVKIQRSVGIRWDLLKNILRTLNDSELIEKEIGKDDKIIYKRTQKGILYIEHCKELKKLLNYR
jgi:predicted transcriptional regulator